MDQKTRDRVHLRTRLWQNNADKEVRRGLASEDNDNKIRVLQTTVDKLRHELSERVRHLERRCDNFDAFTTHFTDKARYNHKRVRPDTDVQNSDDLWAMVMDNLNEIEKADTENVVCPSDEALDVILEPITTSPTAKLLCEETLSPEEPLVPDDDLLKTLGLETIQNCPQGSSSN